VGFCQEGVKLGSGEDNFFLTTLPYFVGGAIIMTQYIVCQEKNIILDFFLEKKISARFITALTNAQYLRSAFTKSTFYWDSTVQCRHQWPITCLARLR
jgi:hypothetical protein